MTEGLYKFYRVALPDNIQMFPAYENGILTKAKVKDEKFSRISFNGALIFLDDEYDFLYEQRFTELDSTLDLEIYFEDVFIARGELELEGGWDMDNKRCSLQFTILDQYSVILNDIDTEVNVLNTTPVVSITTKLNIYELEFISIAASDTPPTGVAWMLWANDGFSYTFKPFIAASLLIYCYAREAVSLLSIKANELIGVSGWLFVENNPDGTIKIAREWTIIYDYPFLPPSQLAISDYLVSFADNVFNETHINNEKYQIFDVVKNKTRTGVFLIKVGDPEGKVTYFVDYDSYYDGYDEITYTRARLLKDMLSLVLITSDTEITIKSDAYKYMDTYQESSFYPLANIAMMSIADVILAEGGGEKPSGASIVNWTWGKFINFLRSIQLYWFLTPDKEFYLKYISEISPGASSAEANNLNDYGGRKGDRKRNWSQQRNERITNPDSKYNKIKRKLIALNIDHRGLDIDIPAMDDINRRTKEIDYSDWFTDIWDIQSNSDRYPEGSLQHLVPFATRLVADTVELLTEEWTDTGFQQFTLVGTNYIDWIKGTPSGDAPWIPVGEARTEVSFTQGVEYPVTISNFLIIDHHRLFVNINFVPPNLINHTGNKIVILSDGSAVRLAAITNRYIRTGQIFDFSISGWNFSTSNPIVMYLVNASGSIISGQENITGNKNFSLTATGDAIGDGAILLRVPGALAGNFNFSQHVPTYRISVGLLDSESNVASGFKDITGNGTTSLVPTVTSVGYFVAWVQAARATGSMQMSMLNTGGLYEAIISPGALSSNEIMNAPLSLANLDEYHGKYEMPYHTIIMNGQETEAEISKDDRTPAIPCPINIPDDMDFDNEVELELFNVEPESLVIRLKGTLAKFIGKI